jgi:threonylcarbamoyladenosine tRNA methylthiotransferase MtaB
MSGRLGGGGGELAAGNRVLGTGNWEPGTGNRERGTGHDGRADPVPELRVAFATLGCKVNHYDTAAMQTFLAANGCRVVSFDGGGVADVYVVNTCTVTDRADAESRRLARRARRRNPAARVVVTGCYAQTSPRQAAAVEGVDYVIGIGRLPDVLRAVRDEIAVDETRVLVDDVRKATRVSTLGAEVFAGQTRAFLKVQEGCDLFCTFCIVPFARGKSRSVEPRRVLAELERLAARGFREVVMTGVHLGGYGRDLSPRLGLADLVEMIAERSPIERVRLSSIDPPEMTPRLLRMVAAGDVLCPHFHMPVQAAADPVLRRMRRQYDVAQLADVVAEIARTVPGCGLGTDVIAGFPGESEEDFAAGLERLAAMPFTYFHVFPYSKRRGTTAAKASDALRRDVVLERARRLRELGERKRREFHQRHVGRSLSVLVESSRDPDSGLLVGYDRAYLRVLLAGGDELMNRVVAVRAVERVGERLRGEPIP